MLGPAWAPVIYQSAKTLQERWLRGRGKVLTAHEAQVLVMWAMLVGPLHRHDNGYDVAGLYLSHAEVEEIDQIIDRTVKAR